MSFQPTKESLSAHVIPNWYQDAKLGIFIHWGLYSVPSWATLASHFDLGDIIASGDWKTWFANNRYAEWYLNSLRINDSPTARHHAETYGSDFSYFDFSAQFKVSSQQADFNAWADLFKHVGARYVVLTTKHHDGFLLWPSKHPNPFHDAYFSERDLVGELTQAVRERDMKMGLYYSGGLDWTFEKAPVVDLESLFTTIPQSQEYADYATHHWYELMERYQPSILWNDIGYPKATNTYQLFADFYNTIGEGVINNRFNQTRPPESEGDQLDHHYDFSTPEYTSYDDITEKKWEATRGIGHSFGHNQLEGVESYLTPTDLIHSFIDIVSKNGNLLLNIGPAADGTIPDQQRRPLQALGDWLAINGEAIFDSRYWHTAIGSTTTDTPVRFTQKANALYATVLDQAKPSNITLKNLRLADNTTIQLLGEHQPPLIATQLGNNVTIALPEQAQSSQPAYSLKISPQPERVTA